MGNVVVWIVWFGAAFACLASVVSFRNPFYSALALIGNLGSLAVLYLLLSAEFVAAAQVLVYAGAVMVMFLFVIAYLGGEADAPFVGRHGWQTVGAIIAAAAIFIEIVVAIGETAGDRLSHEAKIDASFGSPAQIGRLFLTDHLLAFEVTSIVLLAAAVGGVVLGHHSRRFDAGT
jgi:NADH-quinone oxidoreductase subunit J